MCGCVGVLDKQEGGRDNIGHDILMGSENRTVIEQNKHFVILFISLSYNLVCGIICDLIPMLRLI